MSDAAGPASANAAMRQYWNEVAGPRWVSRAEIQESRNIEVGQLLLAEIRAAPGERVLDVGCGPGATALPLAAAVGPRGQVTGIDISEPMLGLLRRRIAERGIMQTIQHPTTGAVKMPAWPVRFDGTPARVKPSPLLGQHSAEVLGSWLGLGAQDIDGLKQDGII